MAQFCSKDFTEEHNLYQIFIRWQESKKKTNWLNIRHEAFAATYLLVKRLKTADFYTSAPIQNHDGFAAILLTLLKLKYKGDNFKKHLAPLLIWPGFLFKKKEKES